MEGGSAYFDAEHVESDDSVSIGTPAVEIDVVFEGVARKPAVSNAFPVLLNTIEEAFGQFLQKIFHLASSYA